MKPKVEIYTWSRCPFCIRAKALLDKRNIDFIEYCIDGDDEARQAMIERAYGKRSLPQIFINDQSIGGCDDLYYLDNTGDLEALLREQAA